MNLKKLFAWKTQEQDKPELPVQARPALAYAAPSANSGGKVVYLNGDPNEVDIGIDPNMDATTTPPSPAPKGLMYESELAAFFASNYFGLGRNNGAILKNLEVSLLGRAEIIANFQNSCSAVLERKHSKINKLRSELIAIEGLSPPTSKRLDLACFYLEREVSLLEAQMSLAEKGEGWVLEALNRYQMGFHRGMREAVEFELLAG